MRQESQRALEKARRGEIKDFTGIDAPYEEPINPEIVLDTNNIGVKESVAIIVEYLQSNGYIGCENKGKNLTLNHT